MATLSIPNSFSPNTTALSADVNANFTAISTFLNSTKVNQDNIQDAGIPTAKLADGAVTAAKITDATITLAKLAAAVANALTPAGTVSAFAGTTTPDGYLACDGSEVSRTTYSSLFTAIGTTHGVGDGSTTFHLPDYRGRFLRGADGTAGRDPDSSSRTAMVSISGTGATTNGSVSITGLSTTTNLGVGMKASGSGIPNGATIASVTSSTSITLSAAATSTGTNTLTFTSGNTGNAVGSVQSGQVGSHNHSTSISLMSYADGASTGGLRNSSIGQGSSSFNTSTDGGEPRPLNAYVNYLIKT